MDGLLEGEPGAKLPARFLKLLEGGDDAIDGELEPPCAPGTDCSNCGPRTVRAPFATCVAPAPELLDVAAALVNDKAGRGASHVSAYSGQLPFGPSPFGARLDQGCV